MLDQRHISTIVAVIARGGLLCSGKEGPSRVTGMSSRGADGTPAGWSSSGIDPRSGFVVFWDLWQCNDRIRKIWRELF